MKRAGATIAIPTFDHVLLPQAIRIMAPSFINQWVSLVKDTSLAYIVGVPELAFLANQVNSRLMDRCGKACFRNTFLLVQLPGVLSHSVN